MPVDFCFKVTKAPLIKEGSSSATYSQQYLHYNQHEIFSSILGKGGNQREIQYDGTGEQ